MMFRLTINSVAHRIEAEPDTPLLWVLRDTLGLTGTKFGCGVGACGACTVHLNGEAVRSCSVPIEAANNATVVTIEGLAAAADSHDQLHPVQKVWVAEQVPQCGYCQSGMIMAVAALLAKNPKPTDADIDNIITNLCRCGTYLRVRRAIHTLTKTTP